MNKSCGAGIKVMENRMAGMSEKTWKKILGPTDFSAASIHSLKYAIGACRETGAMLTLVHVVPTLFPLDSAHIGAVVEEKRLVKEAKLFLENFREKQVPESITGTNVILTGTAWHEITELAAAEKFDLIVIGTHGHTALQHLWLGSTAENVVRHAPCAVLTVRDQPLAVFMPGENPIRARKILVPTDFSELSKKSVRKAVSLAERFNAKIDLVHVLEPPPYPEFGYVHVPLKEGALRKAAEAHFEKLRAEIPALADLVNFTPIRTGNAPYEIVQVARELNSELIVIATHGRTGIKRLALGSTAEKVVRHAPCPVLVLR
jgi:nucleotide-binding universal stress UspA family protein